MAAGAEVLAAGEGAEELVVEVVAVGEDDDGWVFHRWIPDKGAGVEGHGEALAGALGVPDDAYAAVAGLAAGPGAGLVAATDLGNSAQAGGAESLGDGDPDRVELVIAGHLLGEGAAAVVLKHDEVADQGDEAVGVADALEHHLDLGRVGIGQGLAGDGAPRLEPLAAGGECADTGLGPVGHDEQLVEGEEGRQLGLVGLELAPGGPDGGVLVGRVLDLDDREGQAVDEQDDVGPAGAVAVLGDGELIDGEEVVVGGGFEVDDVGLGAADRAAGPVLDGDSRDEHSVEGAIAGLEGGAIGTCQPAEGVIERAGRQVGV